MGEGRANLDDAAAGLPDVVRNKALSNGAAAWLDELPGLLAELEDRWSLTVGAVFADATEAFVAEATLDDGAAAVLKLFVPHSDRVNDEITVLELVGGQGCVGLLRSARSHHALLVERLGPALVELDVALGRRLEILTSLAAQVWRPAPESGLPAGVEKAQRLIERIGDLWPRLDEPCSERAVDHAMACAEGRIAAYRQDRAMLVHGDVHQWNALRSGTGFKLVDPDGLLAEPEYDLGVLMREDPVELLQGDPWDRARLLAARTGLDPLAIWQWGVVERVSTGLMATEIGLEPVGREMLAAADAIAASNH